MVDFSEYQDVSNASVADEPSFEAATLPEPDVAPITQSVASPVPQSVFTQSAADPIDHDLEIYAEYSGNVKTLVQLVNDLPDGVTRQTGAQIIRLTMEAMGISMENVLSDAQSVQSDLLEAVRSNIKKTEEYRTIIRKLESEIRYYQGKANELSEIIDLFIMTNASPTSAADL